MTWTSYYSAPMVFAVMLPFWSLICLGWGALYQMPWRHRLIFAAAYSLAASAAVWLLLYVLPGLSGAYRW